MIVDDEAWTKCNGTLSQFTFDATVSISKGLWINNIVVLQPRSRELTVNNDVPNRESFVVPKIMNNSTNGQMQPTI